MKYFRLLYLVVLLSGLIKHSKAQEWIKIRSIENNNTVDEWVRKGSNDAKSYNYTHDTLYVDSFRSQMFALIATLQYWRKIDDSISKVPITFHGFKLLPDSTVYFYDYTRSKSNKKNRKKKHKQKNTEQSNTISYKTYRGSCPLDTVYGRLKYNNLKPDIYDGCTSADGYWVGCTRVDLEMSPNYYFIPSYAIFTRLDSINSKPKLYREPNGKFYLSNGTHIGNYRVYGLGTN